MSEYTAEVLWERDPAQDFLGNRYSRKHLLRFDGGVQIPGSVCLHSTGCTGFIMHTVK